MKQGILALALAGCGALAVTPLWAAEKIELTTRVSGVVDQVLVKVGQRVSKGTVLLRLETTILQARLDEGRRGRCGARTGAGTGNVQPHGVFDV